MENEPIMLSEDALEPEHPGLSIQDELEHRNINVYQLGRKTKFPAQIIDGVILGIIPMTWPFALALEKLLGGGATFWMGMQAGYESGMAKKMYK